MYNNKICDSLKNKEKKKSETRKMRLAKNFVRDNKARDVFSTESRKRTECKKEAKNQFQSFHLQIFFLSFYEFFSTFDKVTNL